MKRAFLLSLRLPAAVFALGVTISLVVAHSYRHSQLAQLSASLSAEAAAHLQTLEQRLSSFVDFNRGLAAHVSTSTTAEIDRPTFQGYIDALDTFGVTRGGQAVGYAPRVTRSEIEAFENRVRAQYPGFAVRGSRQGAMVAYPVLHVHSANARTVRGLDYSSIPERRDAMASAAALGRTVISAPHRSPVTGARVMLMFTPVYGGGGSSPAMGEDRQAALRGFVYSAVTVDELVAATLAARFRKLFDLEIYDDSSDGKQLIYDGDGIQHTLRTGLEGSIFHAPLTFAERRWTVMFFPQPGAATGAAIEYALVLATGLLLSLVVSWLVWWSGMVRARRHNRGAMAERLEQLFEQHPFAVYYLDTSRRFVSVNDKAVAEFGLTRKELVGASSEALIAPSSRDRARGHWKRVLSGEAVSYETTIEREGEHSDMHLVLLPMVSGGSVAGVLGIAQNITERKRERAELVASKRMLQSIVDNLPQMVFWKGCDSRFLGCNRSFAEFIGLEPEDVVGKTDYDLSNRGGDVELARVEQYRAEDLQVIHGREAMIGRELLLQRGPSGEFWSRTSKVPLLEPDGRVTGVLGVVTDITERKMYELQLEQMAHYDSLTHLANRPFFLSHLEKAIQRSTRSGQLLGMAYFDIDRFKSINDTWGHDIGDVVIRTFASRMKRVIRESDMLGRMGGDEFVMFSEGLVSQDEMERVAERLLAAARKPIRINEELTLDVSTSIGIAFHREGLDAAALLRLADQAMYTAKQSGRDAMAAAV